MRGGVRFERVWTQTTAATHPLCTAIAPFYWEIGNVDGSLVTGSQGTMYSAVVDDDRPH